MQAKSMGHRLEWRERGRWYWRVTQHAEKGVLVGKLKEVDHMENLVCTRG